MIPRHEAPYQALPGSFHHPAQVIATGFGAAVLLGTFLLSLPIATTSGISAGWLTALFTATSAVCVTGLVVVDTESHWSVFGEVVIAALIQVGGLGIMTLATLFTVLVAGRHVLLVLLMFIGRIGPLSLGSALALKERARHCELPEERVIVG
ncbi:potassium transporter TrkG [Nonomuraea sp. NBC_00507]|uniref:potassium transporter TrkG n=1 Tax=Nonomuraea sp. NBC_00507 TaxID=2976002 RepID=UPI003FA5D95C